MASDSRSTMLRQFRTLFEAGTVAGLTDGQLLERFLTGRDEVAFEALVARHGPMVLGVCRRALTDPNDAADAFQATFLILVRKAASIRVDDTLGRWLYGVSRRVANRARATASRRPKADAGEAAEVEASSVDPDRFELASLLDEELAKLPESFRSALILCDLEGLTHEQAARDLRCPVGTIKSRLSRAREKLRTRLERRGVAPSMLVLAPRVPVSLVESVVKASLSIGSGNLGLGVASASVVVLSEGVLKSMSGISIKLAAVTVLSLGIIGSGVGVLGQVQKEQTRIPNDGVSTVVESDDPPPAGKVPVERSSSSPLSAIELAHEVFPEEHWANAKDLKFSYYDATRGLTMYGQEYEKLNDGRQIRIKPFALVWRANKLQPHKIATSKEAIIDLDQPFETSPQGTSPTRVTHAKLLSEVLIRESKGNPVSPGDSVQISADSIEFNVVMALSDQTKPSEDDRSPQHAPDAVVKGRTSTTGANRIERKLNEPISLNIKETPIAEAFDFLHQYTQINFILDPKALIENGMTPRSPISLTCDQIKLKQALKYLLNPLRLTYKVEEDVVLITTRPRADRASRDHGILTLHNELEESRKRLTEAERVAKDPLDPSIVPARARVSELEAAVDKIDRLLETVLDRTAETDQTEPAGLSGRKSWPGRGRGVEPPREFQKVSMPDYIVEPPDIIVVEVLESLPGRPITGEHLVRPDGKISLGFYGEVYVAGLTTTEIKAKIAFHLREYLDDAKLGLTRNNMATDKLEPVDPTKTSKIFVDVTHYNSKCYYVQGQVGVPGRLHITGNETVLDAINYAGGLLPDADKRGIRLVRPSPGGTQRELILPVDLTAILDRGESRTNYQLFPGDRLIVDRERKEVPTGAQESRSEKPPATEVEARLQTLERKLDDVLKGLERQVKP